ncbi:hypothetical protein RSOL_062420 [Rhizoctonia solani AG-3 Rhs1AP]|uniref:Uncharacterized protein n=1 Tax=Rhizoctonia solani AG-3 Rhs1AP TaxID=1086054 RepID=X8IY84_9AGAM|nr:hypothetical protein RSOL_062420 [Rhizoctonia solani AG-3 Rhs1AP]
MLCNRLIILERKLMHMLSSMKIATDTTTNTITIA